MGISKRKLKKLGGKKRRVKKLSRKNTVSELATYWLNEEKKEYNELTQNMRTQAKNRKGRNSVKTEADKQYDILKKGKDLKARITFSEEEVKDFKRTLEKSAKKLKQETERASQSKKTIEKLKEKLVKVEQAKTEPEKFYCPDCGAQLLSIESFCSFCGANIEKRIKEVEEVSTPSK